MNYSRHYWLIIERAKTRSILPNYYFEKHHIIPKCVGGTNDPSNIVKLFPEEHYVAHQLLVKMFPTENKLLYAARLMCRDSKNTKRNNKEYKWLREKFSKSLTGIPRTDEVKDKIRKANTGKTVSDHTKDKIRAARKSQHISPESNLKRSNTAKAKGIRPPDSTGRIHSSETKKKISESKKGLPSHWKGKSRPILICPYCNKIGAGGVMNRYHFNNCKFLEPRKG